jgi:hypothetical protein
MALLALSDGVDAAVLAADVDYAVYHHEGGDNTIAHLEAPVLRARDAG